jgi:hypothetical protein
MILFYSIFCFFYLYIGYVMMTKKKKEEQNSLNFEELFFYILYAHGQGIIKMKRVFQRTKWVSEKT